MKTTVGKALKTLKIGAVAEASGTPIETIRFYEREGLLAPARRTESNYRTYGAEDVERLRFIRRCRSLDMALPEIRSLLVIADRPTQDCEAINAILEEHIGHVATRIRELLALEKALKQLREQCDQSQPVSSCGIMRGLFEGADPPAPGGRSDRSHVQGVHRH